MAKKRESLLWFLLPIFLGWIGGVLGYFLVRGKDPDRANYIFLVGLGVSVLVVGTLIGIDESVGLGIFGSPLSLLT